MKIINDCPHCKGSGEVVTEICISKYTAPEGHENEERLDEIADEAASAVADHEKLCKLNPKAKESYDRQLAEVLAGFEELAEKLI